MKKIIRMICVFGLFGVASCNEAKHTFSLQPDNQSFQQNTKEVVQRQIDILWVVDNSGSMAPFQKNLVSNFNSFIQKFVDKGYDFHVAVTTTDAYLAGSFFTGNPTYSMFKDGIGTVHTGFPIIDTSTPNIISTFTTNASQGDLGSGDERGLSSLRASLDNPGNSNFLRNGSFFAVIILSDEDDFSSPKRPENSSTDHDYSNPSLETVDSYVSYLDKLTHSLDPSNRNYNVSAVTVMDNQCLTIHQADAPSSILGKRYIELATKTGGVVADICSPDYSSALHQIQKKILELSTEFGLKRRPRPESIRIIVNGQIIPQDKDNGWTYDSKKNSIQFHGNGIPPKGADISIGFAPAEPT